MVREKVLLSNESEEYMLNICLVERSGNNNQVAIFPLSANMR